MLKAKQARGEAVPDTFVSDTTARLLRRLQHSGHGEVALRPTPSGVSMTPTEPPAAGHFVKKSEKIHPYWIVGGGLVLLITLSALVLRT